MIIYGSIDNLRRPYVQVEAPGDHSILLQIDTGVNRKLVVNRHAIHRLGARNIDIDVNTISSVQLGDLSKTSALQAIVQFIWFGKLEVIDTLVTDHIPDRPPGDKDPVGLIGTELLKDCKLTIDFPKGVVEIER